MASKNRKKAPGKPPVTSHPLFPAVVALWFGALFGLGSLAIRATLLESLVVSTHIDSVVPAAAPPLGVTARILLALVLAALGAALGALIARALARPKPVVRERSRSVGGERADLKLRPRDSHPDAPARRPISAHEEFGDDDYDDEDDDDFPPLRQVAAPAEVTAVAEPTDAASAASPLPGRRRALAIEADHRLDIPELAPLPGGEPQILDISAFPLASEQSPAPAAELDLGSFAPVEPSAPFAAPAGPVEAAARFAAPAAMPPVSTEAGNPFAPPPMPAVFAPPPTSFAPPVAAAEATPVASELPAPEAEASDAPAGRMFDMLGASTRLFGPPKIDVADVATPERAEAEDFSPPVPVAEASAEPVVAPEDAPVEAPVTEPVDAIAVQPAPFAEVVAPSVADVAAEAVAEPAAAPAAAPTAANAFDELSPVELIERLARSLERRRQQAAVAAAPVVTDVAQPAPLAPFAPPVAEAPAAPEPAPAIAAMPEAAAPGEPAMPAALRPLTFDDDEEDDGEALSSLLPPRRIVALVDTETETDTETASDADDEDEDDDGYSSLLDLSFTNTEARPGFVRIDERAPAHGAVEPVVIFPGQAAAGTAGFAQPASAFAAPPRTGMGGEMNAIQPAAPHFAPAQTGATMTTAQAATEAEQRVLRRFDAPGSSGVVGQEAMAVSPPRDPEETERALRAALATLQRMSGAA
ncbi:MAG: hypothetical protein KGL44_00690 [Sphingomonadales bacterium]|nr:hypothetical protein [Sphingomonadales bacterium]